MSPPTDLVIPDVIKRMSPAAIEFFIETICEFADGEQFTEIHYSSAVKETSKYYFQLDYRT